jgi:predicted GTPase
MREQIQKELLAWGKQHVVKRLVIVYVEEVGRAAIDLYGGRLRVLPAKLARHVTAQSARDLKAAAGDAIQAEPLRILVAGQIGAGKSSLVNALADEMRAAVDALPATDGFTPYRLEREGLPAALIFDSPGLASDPAQRRALIERASAADLLIWVCAANRADRAADAQALAELRAHFAERPNRRRPPMLLVLSHADRLRPFQDWHPPYDLNDRQSAKAASMRAAVEACAADLGFPAEQAIPSCLDISVGLYNIDAVWAGLMALLPDAQQARLVRTLREADGAWDWRRIWLQARNGGRVLAGAALR